MQKILELTEQEFMTGIAPGSQLQNAGLWHTALGITVVRNPFLESDDVGILQAAPEPTDISESVIEDIPIAWTLDPIDPDTGFGKVYFWGDEGRLYAIDLTADNDLVDLNPGGGQGDAANGLFLMNHSNGTRKLYYFREADLGWYGDIMGSPTFHTADYDSGDGIEDTVHHPTHKLFDRQYFGNGRYVGEVEDDGSGGLTITGQALDLEVGQTVTTIWDDSHYLVIGASSNPSSSSASNLIHGNTKIYFWDTNSNSWDREWSIDDASIYAIRRVGPYMQALTSRGLYVFTIDTPPQRVLPFMNSEDAPTPQFPSHFAADVIGEALVWGNAGGSVSSWGKFLPTMKNAYMKPFSGYGGVDLPLVCASAKTNNLFVASIEPQLFRTLWNGAGQENVTAETIYIDLKRWWQVGRVVIEFAEQLQEDDSMNVNLSPDDASAEFSAGVADFAEHGAIRTKEMYCTLEARKLKLFINFNGGACRIRRIEVWGDPLSSPTHTRATVGVPT